jgi:hypothetical protein
VNGLRIKAVSFCFLSIFVCSRVTRTSLRQGGVGVKKAIDAVKPDTLSDYIRAVYRLSGESANKQDEQRATLLSQGPQFADPAARAQQNPDDTDARTRLVAAYMEHRLHWAAYELLTTAQVANPDDSEIN